MKKFNDLDAIFAHGGVLHGKNIRLRHQRPSSRSKIALRLSRKPSRYSTRRRRGNRQSKEQESIDFPRGLDPERYDNRILALAHNLTAEKQDPVILVTKDLNLRIKADVMGIHAEDFYNDKVNYDGLYRGFREVQVSDWEMELFYKDKRIPWDHDPPPDPQEFLIMRNHARHSQSALARYHRRELLSLNHDDAPCWGIRPRR